MVASRKSKVKQYQGTMFGIAAESEPMPEVESNILPFLFEGIEVRSVIDGGMRWFVAADVCMVLGIERPSEAVNGRTRTRADGTQYQENGLDEDEKGYGECHTPRGRQKMLVVSKNGAYRLAFSSSKDTAKRFQRWLLHDVVDSIDKTGGYSLPARTTPEVAKTMRRLGCDRQTAMQRLKLRDENKSTNAFISTTGGVTPNTYKTFHIRAYGAQFGEGSYTRFRSNLRLLKSQSVLDRLDYHAMNDRTRFLAIARRKAEDEGLTEDQHLALIDRLGPETTKLTLSQFGPAYTFGITEDAARGKVVGIVRMLPSPN